MIKLCFLLASSLFFCSCEQARKQENKTKQTSPFALADSLKIEVPKKALDSKLSVKDSLKARQDSLSSVSVPVLGYRFIVKGDFNGDHQQDTLVERYTDSLRQKEVAKYDQAFDYFDSWFLADRLNKQSFLSHATFKPLEGGIMGFIYIENCGDITGDGRDDLFVLPHNGGASNCVIGYFYTLKNKQWIPIKKVPVWQWQFPDTPDAAMQHSMFGSYDNLYTTNDSLNKRLEIQLQDFRFVKRYRDQSIEYECRYPLDDKEMDSLSKLYEQQELIVKRFKPVMLDNHLYLQDRKQTNIFYGNITCEKVDKKWVYTFPYDDLADAFWVRMYYKKGPL